MNRNKIVVEGATYCAVEEESTIMPYFQNKTFCPFADCIKECDQKLSLIMGLKDAHFTVSPIRVYLNKPECYTQQEQLKLESAK